ncbi:MAG TPA: c-type cytochrome [Candidatus Binatia bacterium]|nr:c-type cytochrome [Candidatus Binatia bacterium]
MRWWRERLVGVGVPLALVASPVRAASLSAEFDGSFTARRASVLGVVAATFAQHGRAVRGTLHLTLPDPALAGSYAVRGQAAGRRVVLVGRAGARSLAWHGRWAGASTLRGRATVRAPGRRVRGALVLAVRGGADACAAYFRDEVLARVLVPICARCHVATGLARGTRLRVDPTNLAATRASVGQVIDPANPAASPVLHKPLGELGHGGGVQLAAGGPEIEVLRHWVDLVTQNLCAAGSAPGGGSGGGGGTGAELYGARCASCHGPDARGLDGRPNIRCNRAIHDVVRSGRVGASGTMPAFPDLMDAEIVTIQQYLNALCAAGGASGADLYAGNCATCHGGDAGGGPTAPSIRCATRVADAVARGRGSVMPAFPALDTARADAVIAFLASECEAAGVTGRDLWEGNCGTCHGPTGGGGTSAEGIHGPDVRCAGSHDFVEKLTSGEPPMPAFPSLLVSPRLERLVAWVAGACSGGDD